MPSVFVRACTLNQPTTSTLAILDGDVYGTRFEREGRVKCALTGDQPAHQDQRRDLMKLIRALAPRRGANGKLLSPEQVLHWMLHGLDQRQFP